MNILLGLGLSLLLATAAALGVSPIIIVSSGSLATWLLLARISRLAK